jgi:hypothetical protein
VVEAIPLGELNAVKIIFRGSVMKGSEMDGAPERGRVLNAVALQNAVLCAECDVVSDSPTTYAWYAGVARFST